MEKYTEAQKRASEKYLKEKTDSIQIRAQKGTKARWRAAASNRGKSLNRFIVETVEAEIKEAPPADLADDEPPAGRG